MRLYCVRILFFLILCFIFVNDTFSQELPDNNLQNRSMVSLFNNNYIGWASQGGGKAAEDEAGDRLALYIDGNKSIQLRNQQAVSFVFESEVVY